MNVELYGAACPEAHTLIKALATHQAQRSGGGWSVSQCVSRRRQRLSLVLQRSISRAVANVYSSALARPGSAPPDKGAYARIRLLLRPAAAVD